MADTDGLSETRMHQTDDQADGQADSGLDDAGSTAVPVLERSGARLRIPTEMLSECLRMAHEISLSDPEGEPTLRPAEDSIMKRLEAADILVDGRLDPVAAEILGVINKASLIITVDLRYGIDTSTPMIWATPRLAVVGSSADTNFADFRPVDVSALPNALGDLVVLRSPRFVGEAPISIATEVLNKITTGDGSNALAGLQEGGLDDEQAHRVLRFLNGATRHWEIVSTWATEEGQESAELHGLDAGPDGQWLRASTGGEGPGQVTYTPQGHGEVMKAFRSVMPRNWLGTPLNRPPI